MEKSTGTLWQLGSLGILSNLGLKCEQHWRKSHRSTQEQLWLRERRNKNSGEHWIPEVFSFCLEQRDMERRPY